MAIFTLRDASDERKYPEVAGKLLEIWIREKTLTADELAELFGIGRCTAKAAIKLAAASIVNWKAGTAPKVVISFIVASQGWIGLDYAVAKGFRDDDQLVSCVLQGLQEIRDLIKEKR
jgi:hypothetical protein